jgi:hypothetical protein
MTPRRSAAWVADRPIPGAGPNQIVALKRPFATCGKLRPKVYGAQPYCRDRTNAIRQIRPSYSTFSSRIL